MILVVIYMVSDVTLGSDPFGDAVSALMSRRVRPFVTLRPALPTAGEIAAEARHFVSHRSAHLR